MNEAMEQLKDHAIEVCENRDHNMHWTLNEENNAIAECVDCGMEVQCLTKVAPNQIDIGGAAVALNCPTQMWYIHKYSVSLQYGGAEEGGWYFTAGRPTGMTFGPFVSTESSANDQCRTMNYTEIERRKREEAYDFYSVLSYQSNHYEYDLSTDPEPEAFPANRPHYE